MARCGCAGTTCSCKIVGEGGIVVTGAGTITNPYRITGGAELQVQDTTTVDLTLLGNGSTTNPYVLTATATLNLGDLLDVDTSGGLTGYVPAMLADGSFALAPPSTAPVGAVATGLSLDGDGSGGDPLVVRLDALSGLEVVGGGLRLDPYTITTPGDLDPTFGALPSGSIVSDTDGLNAWLKSDTGWATLIEDTGLIATVAGNITAAAGWTVNLLQMRRKNGTVQLRVGLTTTVDRSTATSDGNMVNVAVATVLPTEFRPVIQAPLRVLDTGSDVSMYISTDGQIFLTNLPIPTTYPAGSSWNMAGTYIGQG